MQSLEHGQTIGHSLACEQYIQLNCPVPVAVYVVAGSYGVYVIVVVGAVQEQLSTCGAFTTLHLGQIHACLAAFLR